MEVLLAILIVACVAVFVTVPLRRGAGEAAEAHAVEDPVRAELEARKEAKYRQIRDAETDRAAGKLTEEDYQRLDRELRVANLPIDRLLAGLELGPARVLGRAGRFVA